MVHGRHGRRPGLDQGPTKTGQRLAPCAHVFFLMFLFLLIGEQLSTNCQTKNMYNNVLGRDNQKRTGIKKNQTKMRSYNIKWRTYDVMIYMYTKESKHLAIGPWNAEGCGRPPTHLHEYIQTASFSPRLQSSGQQNHRLVLGRELSRQ